MSDDEKKREKFSGLLEKLMSEFSFHMFERIQKSWCLAERGERIHRMRTITTLIVELEKIRAVSIQATGIGEGLIEQIIEGDWAQAEAYLEDLTMVDNKEDPYGRNAKHRALWDNFTTAAKTAIAEARRLTPGVRPRRS